MEKLNVKIAGEIALSDAPGDTMKKWREIFGITQAKLSKHLGISTSTISDYEGNRRMSPGIAVVRRFIDALLAIDAESGGQVTKRFHAEEDSTQFYETGDFGHALSANEFAKLIDARVITDGKGLEQKKLYGWTLVNSIKVILELPYTEFPKMFGMSADRAFIFTDVSTGRSPMVVVRTQQMKPSVVVLHRLEKVDKLAVKIAQVEKIPLLTTKMDVDEMRTRLKSI